MRQRALLTHAGTSGGPRNAAAAAAPIITLHDRKSIAAVPTLVAYAALEDALRRLEFRGSPTAMSRGECRFFAPPGLDITENKPRRVGVSRRDVSGTGPRRAWLNRSSRTQGEAGAASGARRRVRAVDGRSRCAFDAGTGTVGPAVPSRRPVSVHRVRRRCTSARPRGTLPPGAHTRAGTAAADRVDPGDTGHSPAAPCPHPGPPAYAALRRHRAKLGRGRMAGERGTEEPFGDQHIASRCSPPSSAGTPTPDVALP